MNAGIMTLPDGSPCLAYEGSFPHLISHIEFDPKDFCLTIVFDAPIKDGASKFTTPRTVKKFEFPLDRPFVNLLKQKPILAMAEMQNQQLVDITLVPVVFLP